MRCVYFCMCILSDVSTSAKKLCLTRRLSVCQLVSLSVCDNDDNDDGDGDVQWFNVPLKAD